MLPRGSLVVLAAALCGCSSIGPGSVPRDRADYAAAIGDSWKQQTLLNIVRLRYGDYPMFMEIGQVIAGYQFQTTAGAGLGVANYTSAATGMVPPAVGGTAAIGATFIDRPTIMYAPLTGTDFVRKLMEPMPPSAVLFLLQAGYSATVVMPLTVESINGIVNESRRPGMSRAADPRFLRLTQLLYELQQVNALQIRINRRREGETTVIGFPPAGSGSADVAARIAEVRGILHISRPAGDYSVRYGAYSGKSDEIALVTRSMLQVMLELGILTQVPEADVASGRAMPGATMAHASDGGTPPLLGILSGPSAPSDSYVAVPYKGRWFWIADTDIRSKLIFGSVMLLFSISDVGVRSAPPVVTVPAN